MKQVIQNFKTGELYLDEVPSPSISDRMILVENRSLISASAERSTDNVGKANLCSNNKTERLKFSGKGHKDEVDAFLMSLRNNEEDPIIFDSIYKTTITTFKIMDSLNTGLPQVI